MSDYLQNPKAKIVVLEQELVGVRSQLDRIRDVTEAADSLADDENVDMQYLLESLIRRIRKILDPAVDQAAADAELRRVSPTLANLLKEGRVS